MTGTKWTVPDGPYHFPPELMDLLIDTIPLLCRSKVDVLTFFRGCGVPDGVTADLQRPGGKPTGKASTSTRSPGRSSRGSTRAATAPWRNGAR